MEGSITNMASTVGALAAIVGALVTMMVVIFRTGKRLGEAENKIGNLEVTTKATHDELQDARTEELAKDVQHIQNRELTEIREDIRELKKEMKEQEDDLEKKIDDLKKELDEREDDLEKMIDEVKTIISEKEDDLEKRIDDIQHQFREDIRENRSDIKIVVNDLKQLSNVRATA